VDCRVPLGINLRVVGVDRIVHEPRTDQFGFTRFIGVRCHLSSLVGRDGTGATLGLVGGKIHRERPVERRTVVRRPLSNRIAVDEQAHRVEIPELVAGGDRSGERRVVLGRLQRERRPWIDRDFFVAALEGDQMRRVVDGGDCVQTVRSGVPLDRNLLTGSNPTGLVIPGDRLNVVRVLSTDAIAALEGRFARQCFVAENGERRLGIGRGAPSRRSDANGSTVAPFPPRVVVDRNIERVRTGVVERPVERRDAGTV